MVDVLVGLVYGCWFVGYYSFCGDLLVFVVLLLMLVCCGVNSVDFGLVLFIVI